MILDPNGMPILQPAIDNAETATFNTAFAAIGNAVVGRGSGDNLIINGDFRINQRAYVSGTSLSSGAYAFDRWKATTASTSLTFTAAPQGQLVTINSGGSIATILERANVAAGGRTLSHTGTATMRAYNVGGTPPAYSAGPITVTLDGLADVVVEFAASGGTKTVGFVKLSGGTVATPYTARPYGGELALCQRYYWRLVTTGIAFPLAFFQTAIDTGLSSITYPVPMRANPTFTVSSSTILSLYIPDVALRSGTSVTSSPKITNAILKVAIAPGSPIERGAVMISPNGAGWLAFDAEL